MYAIIYWKGEDRLFPLLNEDKTLRLFDTLKEADEVAEKIDSNEVDDLSARVITITGVIEE